MSYSAAVLLAGMAIASFTQAAQAQQAADAKKGMAFAKESCVACHAISGQGRSPAAQAPSFYELANTPGVNAMALVVALRTSHQRMPNIVIVGQERDDVIAYILSLKKPRTGAS